uniref:EamA domain-containing protein n=1 Tax=Entomoneis paludosa TaxID=265537 RepID=A0A7S2Y710_9STRA|mmetsp:Transcript_20453/g.42901  ORF Transcript_20453/g.42901 Transcript_20453/m.42901 type:complete len:420 (+) Transcript_20453:65-1324(+)|eukprot:CAMPEP_0172458548 /NCGR_PEP_ID=MMETSP1065-20121228/28123_1 /TAXON_ID=265537 /ORGANISM="Amphiprora paludosa, Strain CCMP125" /LENGTH=419 /DNA_ID=CAMNT_0013212865 /DNA_START=22 /DNA_END=1281 /DNA_ORIENTATION=-
MWPHLELAVGILSYIVCSLGGLILVKYLNYQFCLRSWLLVALCSRGTWILSIFLHHFLQYQERTTFHLTWKQCRLYWGVSLFLSLVEIFNAASMNVLPGSLYALLKGSDLPWSMGLSYCILRKRYKMKKIFGVVIVTLGITSVFLLGGTNESRRGDSLDNVQEQEQEQSELMSPGTASFLCVFAAFLNALCSVLTERLLKATLLDEEQKAIRATARMALDNDGRHQEALPPPSKLMVTNLYSMTTSGFSFVTIAIFGCMRSEFHKLPSLRDNCPHEETLVVPVLAYRSSEDISQSTLIKNTTTSGVIVVLCFALIVVSRFGERLSKHWICLYDSAMTFSLVQAGRRLSGVLIMAVLFQETFRVGMWVGTLCCGIGFCLHAWKEEDEASVDPNGENTLQPLRHPTKGGRRGQYGSCREAT